MVGPEIWPVARGWKCDLILCQNLANVVVKDTVTDLVDKEEEMS